MAGCLTPLAVQVVTSAEAGGSASTERVGHELRSRGEGLVLSEAVWALSALWCCMKDAARRAPIEAGKIESGSGAGIDWEPNVT
eukprot:6172255-Pleurochrysis_carterae.AAC.3